MSRPQLQVGQRLRETFGSSLPLEQRQYFIVEIRAVVDEDWIVFRRREDRKGSRWLYRLEHSYYFGVETLHERFEQIS